MPTLRRIASSLAPLVLPLLLVACGGQGCSGCQTQTAPKQTPAALVLPQAAQARLTQHGFDVIAQDVVGLLKAVLGQQAGQGPLQLDVGKLLGLTKLEVSGGFGLFQGKASVRDLVLTLDLAALKVDLVDPSAPARIRVAFDHAQLGVVKGIVAGQASTLGITSDAACHLKNGLDVGKPGARLATVSGQVDLVLGVDAKGQLQTQVVLGKPVLHDIGFALQQDCNLAECKDKLLAEPPCLECELCATGELASDAIAGAKQLLEPILGQLMQVVGNVLVQQVLAKSLNGKPLDVEIPLDLTPVLQKASPALAALAGTPSGPLYLRGQPSPQAFVVQQQGLEAKLDAAVFAKAHPCVAQAGADDTQVFAQLPQGPAPKLPVTMGQVQAGGQIVNKTVDLGLLLSRGSLEEAVWAASRSGLLCAAVDSRQLYGLSGGKLLVTAGMLDLALPGIRHLTGGAAPLRIVTRPTAQPQAVPVVTLAEDPTRVVAHVEVAGFGVGVELLVRGRWLTVLETTAKLRATLTLQVTAGQLAVGLQGVQVLQVQVGQSLLPHAQIEQMAPAVVDMAVALLFQQPLKFDLDLQATLQQVLALPLQAEVLGVQVGGTTSDWVVLGVALQGGKP